MSRKSPLTFKRKTAIFLSLCGLVLVMALLVVPDLVVQWDIKREANKWKRKVTTQKGGPKPNYSPQLMELALQAKTTELPRRIREDITLDSANSPYLVTSQSTVSPGATLTVPPGVEIWFGPRAYLVAQGSLQMHGTAEKPILLKPAITNVPWGGIFIGGGHYASLPVTWQRGKQWSSDINHVQFETALYGIKAVHAFVRMENILTRNVRELYSGLSCNTVLRRARFTYDKFRTQGNVNLFKFYKGNMSVEGCEIQCPQTDKKLDAMDIDSVAYGRFVSNTILGSPLEGTDGIDIGLKSKGVLVANNMILSFADKGVSVGEQAEAVITNNVMAYCGMGVGIKDNSKAVLRHNTFFQNKVGVACYEKNPGMGGGHATINSCLFLSTHSKAVVRDSFSTLTVSGSICDTEALPGPGNQQRVWQLQDPAKLNFRPQSSPENPAQPRVGAYF